MKITAIGCAVAAFTVGVEAFVGPVVARPSSLRQSRGMRMGAETTIPDLLIKTEELKLLSQASKLGLLGKLEAAGLTLKDVERLLPLADELDVIGLAQGLGPSILPLAPKVLDAAPSLLPILSAALSIPAPTLFAGAAASVAAGVAVIIAIPDDSVTNIALQTFLAVPLVLIAPAAFAVGGVVLSSLSSGALVSAVAPKGSSASAPAASAPAVALPSTSGRPVTSAKRAVVTVKAAVPKPKKVVAPRKPAPKVVSTKPAPPGNLKNIPKAIV
ncbi:unnamed protein product [Discosporangium mesarthrocarpum]